MFAKVGIKLELTPLLLIDVNSAWGVKCQMSNVKNPLMESFVPSRDFVVVTPLGFKPRTFRTGI